ncbi:hypothetical protein STCU_01988 [Strigomonas culicis]|uniref:Uncharacterized protein n=1 Tax=Strigomonas culicis TaxID=28005 RepID=S9UY59_9TRYP|nr:hypothetical protein STCU_01988 [Strigomonas culicis]|eukprot:EPY33778.1 hypothetical protein STCU_01988 [Strigomonas culicis]
MANIAYTTPSIDAGNGKYFANVTPQTTAFEATSEVVAMAVCQNTMWLVLLDGGIEVRDVHAGHIVHHFPPSRAHRVRSILSVTCAATGQLQMWLGLLSGTIDVYEGASRGRKGPARYPLLRQLRKHLSCVYCMAESEGRSVFSGSSDFYIAQWRVRDGQLLRVLSGHTNYVRCLLAERAALISGSDDGTVRVWDVDSGATLHVASFHQRILPADGAAAQTRSPTDGPPSSPRRAVLRDRTNQAPAGGAKSGRPATGALPNGVSALCRVGMTIWSGDDSGGLVVWRLQDGNTLLASRPHVARITAITKVGSRVYTASADGTVGLHNALDGTLVQRLSEHSRTRVQALTCAVEVSRYFVWTGAADNTIRCWHHDEHTPMTREREAFNDMRWYYATKRPFAEANHALLEEQRELSELALLASGSSEVVKAFLQDTDATKQTAAMQYYTLEGRLREAQQEVQRTEEQRRQLEQSLVAKRETLAAARQNLQRAQEQLQAARAQPYQYGALLPTAGASYTSAPAPMSTIQQMLGSYGALPAVPPAPLTEPTTTFTATTVPSMALPSLGVPAPSTALSNPLSLTPAHAAGDAPQWNPLVPPSPAAVPDTPRPPTATIVPFVPMAAADPVHPVHVARSVSFEPALDGLPPPPPPPAVTHEAPVVYGVTQKVPVPTVTTTISSATTTPKAPAPATTTTKISSATTTPKAPAPAPRRGSFTAGTKSSIGKRRSSF